MKKLWKVFFCLFLASLFVFTFTSCSTTKNSVDIADIVEPVLEQKPDNSTLEVYPGPIYEVWQIMINMNTYLHAWEMWQNYAESLEETIVVIGDRLAE